MIAVFVVRSFDSDADVEHQSAQSSLLPPKMQLFELFRAGMQPPQSSSSIIRSRQDDSQDTIADGRKKRLESADEPERLSPHTDLHVLPGPGSEDGMEA